MFDMTRAQDGAAVTLICSSLHVIYITRGLPVLHSHAEVLRIDF